MKRLTEQLIEVDSILTKLCEAMIMFKLPLKLADGQSCKYRSIPLDGMINSRIVTAKALIKKKLDIVTANKINLWAPDTLPKVEMTLEVLKDIISIVNKDLHLI